MMQNTHLTYVNEIAVSAPRRVPPAFVRVSDPRVFFPCKKEIAGSSGPPGS